MRQMLMPLMFSHDWSFPELRGEVLVLRSETRGDPFRFANFSAERAGVEPARGSRPQPASNRRPAPIGRPFRQASEPYMTSVRRTYFVPLSITAPS